MGQLIVIASLTILFFGFVAFLCWLVTDDKYSTAIALQAERANPKVWDGAEPSETTAEVFFGGSVLMDGSPRKTYTRELPKTRAREIAEEAWNRLNEVHNNERTVDAIESAILKAQAEWEEGR